MATTIDRTGITLTNDTGTPASPNGDGTLLSAADRTALLDAIDDILAGNVLIGGTLGAEGFGTHSLSAGGTGTQNLIVRNTSAGTTNGAEISVGNNGSATAGRIYHTSSTYTPSAPFVADGFHVFGTQSGGLRLGTTNAAGMAVSTNSTQRFSINSTGIVTLESGTLIHSGFLAYNSANDTGVVSGGAIDFDTEIYDEGGHFASDTFTAPTTGRYYLSASVNVLNATGGAIDMGAYIVTSNFPNGFYIGLSYQVPNNGQAIFSGSVIADMDASDTATVRYYGTGNATIRGSSTPDGLTFFCGRRVW